MFALARGRVVLHFGATHEPRHVQSTTLNTAQELREVRRYLGMSRLTIWSATLRRSRPTMSGLSASGNCAFPGAQRSGLVSSPGSDRLAFLWGRVASAGIAIAASDGTGVIASRACPERCEPSDWSPDGRTLILTVRTAQGSDVWTMPVVPRGEADVARPEFAERFNERDDPLNGYPPGTPAFPPSARLTEFFTIFRGPGFSRLAHHVPGVRAALREIGRARMGRAYSAP